MTEHMIPEWMHEQVVVMLERLQERENFWFNLLEDDDD